MKNLLVWGRLFAAVGISACLLTSCDDESTQDLVDQPNHDGAIETILSVEHIDNFDVVTTTHKVWVNGYLNNTIVHSDTVPKLGHTLSEGQDEMGYADHALIPKDYEFYITVK